MTAVARRPRKTPAQIGRELRGARLGPGILAYVADLESEAKLRERLGLPPREDPQAKEPPRARIMPADPATRKTYPIGTGVVDYFPDALTEIARVSFTGNEQHHPGQPLHWERAKSGDEADALMRHFIERGSVDSDGIRHSAKMAWRALALLQKELETELGLPLPRGAR